MKDKKGCILVTGGAGYIGSHVCKQLQKQGYTPVVFDNYTTSQKNNSTQAELFEGDLLSERDLEEVFGSYDVQSVMHFAASSLVGESVTDPAKYWRNNVQGSQNLLEVMRRFKVKNIIFSSSAAVYGASEGDVITESDLLQPTNPYGKTKYAVENMIFDYADAYGMRYVVYRYFNVAGADPEGEIGEKHDPETHLIPLLIRAAQTQSTFTVYGDNYSTADGTCIRDYVHVCDLADAHIRGLGLFAEGRSGVFNLGTNHGFSVMETLKAVEKISGQPIKFKVGPRRNGDPARLVSSNVKACTELQWKPERSDLPTMITDAWNWHSKNL